MTLTRRNLLRRPEYCPLDGLRLERDPETGGLVCPGEFYASKLPDLRPSPTLGEAAARIYSGMPQAVRREKK